MERATVLVLGAGIVGVSTALQLQSRGIPAIVIDRHSPGLGASFGNSGVIQREAVLPYAMPRDAKTLLRTLLGRNTAARLQLSALPGLLPFMTRYWWYSSKARHRSIAKSYAGLIERCLETWQQAIADTDAGSLLSHQGYLAGFRTPHRYDAARTEADEFAEQYGLSVSHLQGSSEICQAVPHISSAFHAMIHYHDAVTVSDPHALLIQLLAKFHSLGGRFASADAMQLTGDASGYSLPGEAGPIHARHAVIALGADAAQLSAKFSLRLPMGLKRGYHVHFRQVPQAPLATTIFDEEYGYVLTPKSAGIRLTTGAEFAAPSAPPSPRQLQQVTPIAQRLHPLGDKVETTPWMGIRPCMPDMLPVIGAVPGYSNLWCAFGHGHQGLTLGPVTGDIIADLIEGRETEINLAPFSPARF
uniref:NAD(P)/FAD-dependent oxidoreductase n=1 Tax=Pararhizobium sp. IMCC3301 TaxID=3067904 RepID=UPI002740C210|nr:FAD-dependent oxidoreductase [Pararhizobium sp. IMCC3301]